jgi:hypothetical protein
VDVVAEDELTGVAGRELEREREAAGRLDLLVDLVAHVVERAEQLSGAPDELGQA